MDVIRRSVSVFERVLVAVIRNVSKTPMFTSEERVDMLRNLFADEPKVEVASFDGLLVDFAKSRDVKVIVKGLRAVSDFDYELQMAQMNRQLWPAVETLFLMPDVSYSFLSSSLVREVADLGGDVSRFVSPRVARRIRRKLEGERGSGG
jgi:pantetheine-phosphate adenylyltransferase